MPNQKKLSEFMGSSQKNKGISPIRPAPIGKMNRIDTPAHGLKKLNNVHSDSQSIFDNLR